MVVVLVIAILLAIAIPTFLGARERSQDRAAQSTLRNALSAAKVIFAEDGHYYSAGLTSELDKVEPRITFSAPNAGSTGPDVVSINTATCSNGVDNTEAACEATGMWTAPSTCSIALRSGTSQTVCETAGEFSRVESVWAGAAWSESETCFYIRDASEAVGLMSGTTYGSDDTIQKTSCTGNKAVLFNNAPDSEW